MGSAWTNVCRARLTCAVSVKEPEDEGGHLAASPASAPDPNVEKSCYTGLTACSACEVARHRTLPHRPASVREYTYWISQRYGSALNGDADKQFSYKDLIE